MRSTSAMAHRSPVLLEMVRACSIARKADFIATTSFWAEQLQLGRFPQHQGVAINCGASAFSVR